MNAQGIEARQGQDAQRLDATHESPVAASDAPHKDSLMTNPSNRTDVTDAMIQVDKLISLAASKEWADHFGEVPNRYADDLASQRAHLVAMLTAQPQSGEVEEATAVGLLQARYVLRDCAVKARAGASLHPDMAPMFEKMALVCEDAALRSAQPVGQEEVRDDYDRGFNHAVSELRSIGDHLGAGMILRRAGKDDPLPRLVRAAREVAFSGLFDDANDCQQAAIKELDAASEAFAATVPWDAKLGAKQ